ncbi:MAG TPA: hypothetical protein DCY13_05700 [Verrucomicrobiales bacterium]|nr:hypothetical protein [Verrucomicrobiales bacterium]
MNDPKKSINTWQANFYTGLAIVLPVVISIAIVKWLFGTVANITDLLLFFLNWLPIEPRWIYVNGQNGQMLLHWSLLALCLAVGLITLIGRFARHYFGKKLIQLMDYILFRVPLLNKIYGTLKQVNEAFTSSSKSSFKQVVLVEFPREGMYSVGFVTSEHHEEVQARTPAKVVSVFVPTTPNPTTGFLLLLPEEKLTRLEMSVADGIKFIVSLGAVAPAFAGGARAPVPPAAVMAENQALEAAAAATIAEAAAWKSEQKD